MATQSPRAAGDGSEGSGDDTRRRGGPGAVGNQNLARQMLLRRIPLRTLQHTLGNRALARLLHETLPAKEASAPATAELQRKCACRGEGEEECPECRANRLAVQREAIGGDGGSEAPPIVEEVLSTPGQPLAESARKTLEPGFGHDFSQVRIHDDSKAGESASAVNALAYTVGNHIAFGAGQYAPGTQAGNRLLAHELTHTIQQTGGNPEEVQRFSWSDVTSAASNVGQQLEQGAAAVGSTLTSGAESAALAIANAIAAPFGGHVALGPSGGVEITIDDIEITEVSNQTAVLPVGFPTVTLFEEGFKAGIFNIDVWAGTILGDPSVTLTVGPAKLQNIKLLLDPFGGIYSASGQLYIDGAVVGSIEKADETRVTAAGVIPAEPPIPVIATGEVGKRAIFRLVGKGGFSDNVTLTYSSGSLVLNNDVDIKLGGIAELDYEAFLRIEIEGDEICSVIWPFFSHRLGEKGVEITLPVGVTAGAGGKKVTVGKPTTTPISPDSIPTDLQDEHEPTKCLGLEEILKLLCDKGILPKDVCSTLVPAVDPHPFGPHGGGGGGGGTGGGGSGGGGGIGPTADTCSAPVSPGSVQVDTGSFAGSKVNYNSNPKHTKMAQKSLSELSDIQKRCTTKTPPVTVECEKNFCTALARKDAVVYGSQIDSGARARYAILIKAAFDRNNNRYPKGDPQVAMQNSTSPAVGVDIKSGSQTGTYHVIANKPVTGNEFTGAHLVPGNVPPGTR